jgi:4-hydroxybenzoate polyprenyltransferase and related prenyltransferases
MQAIRKWLILFRAHTGILEAPMAVLGAALALKSFNDPILLVWLGFGLLYHYTGYGMNSYADWKNGFDKEDPRKQHHPLNKGTIHPDTAKTVVFGSLILLIIYGIWLGGLNVVSVGCLGLMVISGVTYNYFGKRTQLKFLPIAVVHTMVFVFPYLSYSLEITPSFVLITVAYFIHHVFQIAISGDVKDIDQDEASLIQKMGASVGHGVVYDDRMEPGAYVLYLGFALTIIQIMLSQASGLLLGEFGMSEVLIILLGAWTVYESDKVISNGPFNREKRVEHMSRREISGYLMIHSVFIPVIGIEGFGLVVLFMVFYLLIFSKYMWGTFITPRV